MKWTCGNIVYLILMIFLFGSCKAKKDIVKVRKLDHKITRTILKNLEESSKKPEWFKTRAASTVSGEEEGSFKASIRIRKDSIVWVSVTKFGLAGFNFHFTHDSVKYIDHVKQEYLLGTYKFIEDIARTKLEHSMLENILLGLPMFLEEKSRYKSWNDDQEFAYVLSSLSKKQWEKISENKELRKDSLGYRFWIDPDLFKVKKFRIDNLKDSTHMTIEYKDWKKFEEYIIPTIVTIEVQGTRESDHVKFKMEYYKIKVNKPTRFPFKIPKDYERVYEDSRQLEGQDSNQKPKISPRKI